MWEIEVTDQFDEWWSTLTDDQREAVTDDGLGDRILVVLRLDADDPSRYAKTTLRAERSLSGKRSDTPPVR